MKDTEISLQLVDQDSAELRASLDEMARLGAKRLLAAALEAEVAAHLARQPDERDAAVAGHALVASGDWRGRSVATGAGGLKVNGRRGRAGRRSEPHATDATHTTHTTQPLLVGRSALLDEAPSAVYWLQGAAKWWWLIALATVIAALGAWVTTGFLPKNYASQTTLMVGRPTSDPDPNSSGLYMSETLAGIYAQMATRQPVLEAVAKALGTDVSWSTLRQMVKAAPGPGTNLIDIRVVDIDPLRAQVIAKAVAAQLIEQSPTPTELKQRELHAFNERQLMTLKTNIDAAEADLARLDGQLNVEASARQISDLQSRRQARESQMEMWRTQYTNLSSQLAGSVVNSLAVIEPASPGEPVGPNLFYNVLMAALLGFGLALGAVLLLEYLEDTIKTGDDLERRVGLPELATVSHLSNILDRRASLVTLLQPRSSMAEAYRVLRTNLHFTLIEYPRARLVVSSANPNEGKSTTAANLAVVLAQGGRTVVLVDSDLRRPSLHRFFDLPNSVGMTSLIMDEQLSIESVLRPIEAVPGLSVLTSGPLPPNPAELLESKVLARLLDELHDRADLIILDSPPLLAVADAAIIAKRADATLLVVHSAVTRTDAARRAVELLSKVGVKPIGAVVNNLDAHQLGGRYLSYRYTFQYGPYHNGEEGDATDGRPGKPGSSGPTGTSGPGDLSDAQRRAPSTGPRLPLPAGLPGWLSRMRRAAALFLG